MKNMTPPLLGYTQSRVIQYERDMRKNSDSIITSIKVAKLSLGKMKWGKKITDFQLLHKYKMS